MRLIIPLRKKNESPIYNENNSQEYSQMCEKESKYGGVIEAREW